MNGQEWEDLGTRLVEAYGVRIRKWRRSMSGVAYHNSDEIECPVPRGAKSFAVLAHEVGHRALGHNGAGRRLEDEYQAWEFARGTFRDAGIPMPRTVSRMIDESLGYALAKALNRGLKVVPPEYRRIRHRLVGETVTTTIYGDGRPPAHHKRYRVRKGVGW